MSAFIVALLGLALVVYGLALWSAPLAFIASGAGLLRLAVVLDRPNPSRGDAK